MDNGSELVPGEYVVLAQGATAPPELEGVRMTAPKAEALPAAVMVRSPARWREGRGITVQAFVAAPGRPECTVHWQPTVGEYRALPMERVTAYEYEAEVPVELVSAGVARYYLSVADGDNVLCFPGGRAGGYSEEDLRTGPEIPVMSVAERAVVPALRASGVPGEGAQAQIVAGREPDSHAVRLTAPGFGEPPSSAGLDWPLATEAAQVAGCNTVSFLVRGGPQTGAVEVSLVQSDGNAFGTSVPLTPSWREVTLPLRDLRPMWATKTEQPDLSKLDHITIVFGAWLYADSREKPHLVEVQRVALQKRPDVWEVQIAAADGPIVLVRPGEQRGRPDGHQCQARQVPGMDPGATALRISTQGFDAPPDCVALRLQVADDAEGFREAMAGARSVVIKARAGTPDSTRLELVILERDGSPWGTMDVEVSEEWQAIRIPLEELRLFDHWAHPAGRGGEGDALRPQEAQSVNFCFGSWLYGDGPTGPKAIEIQDVSLSED